MKKKDISPMAEYFFDHACEQRKEVLTKIKDVISKAKDLSDHLQGLPKIKAIISRVEDLFNYLNEHGQDADIETLAKIQAIISEAKDLFNYLNEHGQNVDIETLAIIKIDAIALAVKDFRKHLRMHGGNNDDKTPFDKMGDVISRAKILSGHFGKQKNIGNKALTKTKVVISTVKDLFNYFNEYGQDVDDKDRSTIKIEAAALAVRDFSDYFNEHGQAISPTKVEAVISMAKSLFDYLHAQRKDTIEAAITKREAAILAAKDFAHYFHAQRKDTVDEALAKIESTFIGKIQYEQGAKAIAILEEEGVTKVSDRNVLLASVLQDIPPEADLLSPPHKINLQGVSFLHHNSSAPNIRTVQVKFREDVYQVIRQAILPFQIDVEEEMEKSSFFVNYVHNVDEKEQYIKKMNTRYQGRISLDSEDKYTLFSKDLRVLKDYLFPVDELNKQGQVFRQSTNPLPFIGITTHEAEIQGEFDLNNLSEIDARALLEHLFNLPIGKSPLQNAQYVLFHVSGLFYMQEDRNIIFLPATERYEFFFFHDDPQKLKNYQSAVQKIKIDRDVIITDMQTRVRHIIEKLLSQKLSQHLENNVARTSLEELCHQIQTELHLHIPAKSIHPFEELRHEKYQDILLALLTKLKDPLRRYLASDDIFRIKKHPRCTSLDMDNRTAVALFLKKEQQRFLSPRDFKDFIDNEGTCVFVEDLVLLGKYPDFYPPFLYQRILAFLLRSLIHNKNKQKHKNHEAKTQYDALKNLLGDALLSGEKHKLQSFGFNKYSEEAESAILTQYFSQMGTLFLMEREKHVQDPRLPEHFRKFFKQYLFGEVQAIAQESPKKE